MTCLPQDFKDRMQGMLGEAYPAFIRSYGEEKYQALRVNTLKCTVEEFLEKTPFPNLENVPWENRGFYYTLGRARNLAAPQHAPSAASRGEGIPYSINSGQSPGKHPLHEAGVYYIQEPSAMAPAACLGAGPGERVLDLCAAPGGKATQVACYMKNEGILVCNEIHPARAKILSENVERMGIRNAIVTNETPQRLSGMFEGYFDSILVDAPCSGEGMFRKNEEACAEWSLENVRLCADRQDGILDCADMMLRPGGRIVYSTCTFAPEENEGCIARFLQRHPEYEIEEAPLCEGMSRGVPQWGGGLEVLGRTVRLFPHLAKGEGHYIAVLKKGGGVPEGYRGFPPCGLQKGIGAKDAKYAKYIKEFLQFARETLNIDILKDAPDRLLKFGEQLYLMPEGMPSIDGIRVLRAGLHLGTLKKDRFEPSHALALALKKEEVMRSFELENDGRAAAYLGGMTLDYAHGRIMNLAASQHAPGAASMGMNLPCSIEGEKGWYLMTYSGFGIGWGKLAGQVMKNHYPKGLRKT